MNIINALLILSPKMKGDSVAREALDVVRHYAALGHRVLDVMAAEGPDEHNRMDEIREACIASGFARACEDDNDDDSDPWVVLT